MPADNKAFGIIFEMLDPSYEHKLSPPAKILWNSLSAEIKACISEQTHKIREKMVGGKPTVSDYWDKMLTGQQQRDLLLRIQKLITLNEASSNAESGKKCVIS